MRVINAIQNYTITRSVDISVDIAVNLQQLTPELKEQLIEDYNLQDYKMNIALERDFYKIDYKKLH